MYESSSDGGPAGSFENFKSEGDVLFKQCEYKKALESFNTALDLKPGDFNCLVARSQCHIELGNADAALGDAESILEADPKHIKGLSQKAAALYQKGDFEHALVFYHRGHKLRPEVQAFRLGIQKAQEAIDNSIGENAGVHLNSSGDLTYFYKQEEEAKEAAEGQPRAEAAPANEEQEKELEKGRPDDSKKAKGRQKKGVYSKPAQKRDDRKDRGRARQSPYDTKTCKQLLGELYPDKEYLEKILQETDSSERNTETNMAIRDIAIRCLEYLDTRTDFWQQQKPMYSRKRDKKMREGARSSASNKDPTNYVLNALEKIDEAQGNGEYQKSLDLAKKTLKKVEKWSDEDIPNRQDVVANLHSSIGNAYLEMANYDRALEHHNKDLEIAKQHDLEEARSRALDNLGRVYARTGKFKKAIEVWEEKLPMASSPQESTWLCHEIGRCYLELGEAARAKEFGEKALSAAEEAEDGVWQLNATVLLAQAKVKLGELEGALETFERSQEMAKTQGDKAAESAIEKAIKDVKNKMAKKNNDTVDGEKTKDEIQEEEDEDGKESDWLISIITSDIAGAGTDANVFTMFYGKKDGKLTVSEKFTLDKKGNNFEQGKKDRFHRSMDIGIPYKMRVGHDNSGLLASWHLDRIELKNKGTKQIYTFKCGSTLKDDDDSSNNIAKELPAEGGDIKEPMSIVKYKIQTYTGDKFGSGTDASVFINLTGETGDTGDRPLAKSLNNSNKFESGNMDEFELEAVSLGKLEKIRIGHNGEGGGSGWYLDKVVITCGNGPVMEFPCNKWLDVDEDDGKIVRELMPSDFKGEDAYGSLSDGEANAEEQEYEDDFVEDVPAQEDGGDFSEPGDEKHEEEEEDEEEYENGEEDREEEGSAEEEENGTKAPQDKAPTESDASIPDDDLHLDLDLEKGDKKSVSFHSALGHHSGSEISTGDEEEQALTKDNDKPAAEEEPQAQGEVQKEAEQEKEEEAKADDPEEQSPPAHAGRPPSSRSSTPESCLSREFC